MSEYTPEPFNIRDAWESTQKPFMSQDLLRRAAVCVAACAGIEDPEKEIAALRADKQTLVDALEEAIEGMVDMIGYVPDYFREKWKHDDCIKEAREALASVREKEEG